MILKETTNSLSVFFLMSEKDLLCSCIVEEQKKEKNAVMKKLTRTAGFQLWVYVQNKIPLTFHFSDL